MRRTLDNLHNVFTNHELDLPLELVMRERTFDKIKAAMIEVDEEAVMGLAGKRRQRYMVVFGRDGDQEFFQYRGFKFSRRRGQNHVESEESKE